MRFACFSRSFVCRFPFIRYSLLDASCVCSAQTRRTLKINGHCVCACVYVCCVVGKQWKRKFAWRLSTLTHRCELLNCGDDGERWCLAMRDGVARLPAAAATGCACVCVCKLAGSANVNVLPRWRQPVLTNTNTHTNTYICNKALSQHVAKKRKNICICMYV